MSMKDPLEGYNFFKPLCAPEALKYWQDSYPPKKGYWGQLLWSKELGKWVDCGTKSVIGRVRTEADEAYYNYLTDFDR